MALIGKIRKNSWILIVAIGLGLGGFLLMDMVSAGKGPGDGMSQLVVGKVNGEKIRRTDFEKDYALRYNGSTAPSYQNRNALWDWYVENELVAKEAEALGLGVSPEEISNLEFGDNPSPIIRRNFPNPQQPGAINREQLNYFKGVIEGNTLQEEIDNGRLNATFPDFWLMQRDMIVKEHLQAKLQTLVQKAMYTPTWMAEMGYAEQNETVDMVYVKVPYDQVSNEDVSLSDEDLSAYLKANAGRFVRKREQRVLDYIAFDVLPTAADSSAIKDTLVRLVEGFATAENDSNFVLRHEGTITPSYNSKEEIGAAADTVMKLHIGSVYGPYVEAGVYRLVKVIDRAVLADSADTRHILLSATTPDEFKTADKRADSIINVLRAGTTPFDSLVVKYSQDPGSTANGGKYENVLPNQFVPEFNKVLFITGQIGQLYKVRTTFGVHIVEVLKRSSSTMTRAQVAFIDEAIVPSKETQDAAFQRASQFVASNRDLKAMTDAVAKTKDLRVVSTPAFDNNEFALGQLGFSNDTKGAICWAFDSSIGDVSPSVYSFTDEVRYYDNKYVVVGLSKILPKGAPEVADIRDELEAAVMVDKKAAIISGKISGTDLSAIASKFSVTVDTIANVAFARSNMQGLGNEPKVVAKAVGMTQDQTSGAIQGEAGVFVVRVTRKTTLGQATNLPMIRQAMNRTAQGAVSSGFMVAMKAGADIDDDRASFECN